MRFRKLLLAFFISLAVLFFPTIAKADGEFASDVSVEYKFNTSGTTTIIHKVTLENLFTDIYATSYKLVLDNIEPQNTQAYQDGQRLPIADAKESTTHTLTATFPDALVGKGKIRNFAISFDNNSFAVRTGEVWEISIPRLSPDNAFRNYNVRLLVPTAFGNEAYMSPRPTASSKEDGYLSYSFNKDLVSKTGITAGFGSFQVFSFNLNYHLENPLNQSSITEIALPPDTDLQKIYYQQIEPEPTNITVDSDGNWLAQYTLLPRQRVDVQAKGSVQIFATVRPFPKPSEDSLKENLNTSAYWQVGDIKIKDLAKKLKNPRQIYDYVWQNLSYDYGRVSPNVQRLGALSALATPDKAICMEFTDLFIALSRAAGIAAREINGYAYTENPKIQPLSLVADVLHAWPEYWNSQIDAWVPVDPTWASTTGGVDFFDKLDLRHFTFVIHGKDSVKPYAPGSYKLGSNPQKDVFVSFGQLPQDRTAKPAIKAELSKSIPFASQKLTVSVKNMGPAAFYNLTPQVLFDGKLMHNGYVEVLPPFATYSMQVAIPFSFLGRQMPNTITINVERTQLEVPTNKTQFIIYNLLAIFLVLALLVILVLAKLGKIKIRTIISWPKLWLTKIKHARPFSKNPANPNQP